MGRSTSVTNLKLVQKSAQPLLVSGTPGKLRGHLAIINDSASKFTFSSIPFKSDKLLGSGRAELSELKIAARFHPHQAGTLYFEIPIDSSTPAGHYEANIQVGDEYQPIQVHVFEEIALNVEPGNITLISHGESRFEHELMFENRGNVALPLGSRSEAQLFEVCGPPGILIKERKSACDSVDDNVAGRSSDNSRVPSCVVKLLHEDVTLKPGERRIINGVFEVPGELKPYRHYHADMEILTAHIDLNLYTREMSRIK